MKRTRRNTTFITNKALKKWELWVRSNTGRGSRRKTTFITNKALYKNANCKSSTCQYCESEGTQAELVTVTQSLKEDNK